MFTGIITAVGTIETVTSLGDTSSGVRLCIYAANLLKDDWAVGDSIAIQGACMTIVKITAPYFEVEVSRASLQLTKGLDAPGKVNLERALGLSDRLGGHLVTGHIDGLGKVITFEPRGESYLLKILVPIQLAKYLAYKGSITINGVSLTVNSAKDQAEGCECSINLIPYTLAQTTLQYLRIGEQVNLEVDLIARYVERMLHSNQLQKTNAPESFSDYFQ